MTNSERLLTGQQPIGGLDTGVPHIARIYDYCLGGKDNFAADRAAAEEFVQLMPGILRTVRESRAFLSRAVWFLTADCGIRQLLDIGTGLPTANNTHEVAQRAAPESRIVYVDNDPMVLSHARALLSSSAEGKTDYVDADLRDTDLILSHARETLDFSLPVAVMLIGVLHCIPDADDPYAIVRRLMAAVPRGSYLVLGHPASDVEPERAASATAQLNTTIAQPVKFRGRAEVAGFLDGLEPVDPGLVQYPQWRPGPGVTSIAPVSAWCAVGRKNLSSSGCNASRATSDDQVERLTRVPPSPRQPLESFLPALYAATEVQAGCRRHRPQASRRTRWCVASLLRPFLAR